MQVVGVFHSCWISPIGDHVVAASYYLTKIGIIHEMFTS